MTNRGVVRQRFALTNHPGEQGKMNALDLLPRLMLRPSPARRLGIGI
jgi:hypothetical protein